MLSSFYLVIHHIVSGFTDVVFPYRIRTSAIRTQVQAVVILDKHPRTSHQAVHPPPPGNPISRLLQTNSKAAAITINTHHQLAPRRKATTHHPTSRHTVLLKASHPMVDILTAPNRPRVALVRLTLKDSKTMEHLNMRLPKEVPPNTPLQLVAMPTPVASTAREIMAGNLHTVSNPHRDTALLITEALSMRI